MKLPSSTSLLLATLTVSSSSTSLAAPAGDTPQSEAGMTSSPSGRNLAARQDSIAGRSLRPSNMQQAIETARANNDLEARGLIDSIFPDLGPILCPVATAILTCPAKKEGGKQSMMEAESPMSKQEIMDRLGIAMAVLSQRDSSTADAKMPDDGDDEREGGDGGDGASDDSSDDSFTSPNDSSPPATATDSDSATASSSLPQNPPNTPDMSSTTAAAEPTDAAARRDLPVATSSLPVPVPVSSSFFPAASPPGLPVPLPSFPVSLPAPPAGVVSGEVNGAPSAVGQVVAMVSGVITDDVMPIRRRWMSRAAPQVTVPAAPYAAASGAASAVSGVPFAAPSTADTVEHAFAPVTNAAPAPVKVQSVDGKVPGPPVVPPAPVHNATNTSPTGTIIAFAPVTTATM